MFRTLPKIVAVLGLLVSLGGVGSQVARSDDAPHAASAEGGTAGEVATEQEAGAVSGSHQTAGGAEGASANGEATGAHATAANGEGHAAAAGHDAAGHDAGGHDSGGHGHDAHLGAHGVNKEPQEFKADLAIWTFCVFLLLMGILMKFAWGPIRDGLQKREDGIAEQIRQANEANEQAKGMLAQYDQKLAEASGKVREMPDEARRDAEHTREQIVAQARVDATAERDRAVREIETATDQALKELAEKSTNIAIDLAGRIVQQKLNPSDHARLVEDAVRRMGNPSSN